MTGRWPALAGLAVLAAVAGTITWVAANDSPGWDMLDRSAPGVAEMEASIATMVESSSVTWGDMTCEVRLLGGRAVDDADSESADTVTIGQRELYVWATCEGTDGPYPTGVSTPLVIADGQVLGPGDGSEYATWVRANFPAGLAERVLDDPDALHP